MNLDKKPKRSLVMEEGISVRRMVKLGEPFIWLAGAASALVLFMILLLLAIVVFEGTSFFWPRDVQKFSLKDGSVMAGVIRDRERYEEKDDNGKVLSVTPRIQLMTANRDLTSKDFVWVDESDVVKRERPADVLYVERREWGPLIGWASSLEAEGQAYAADSAGFDRRLQKGIKEGAKRWKALHHLENEEVGRINFEIERIRLKLRQASAEEKSALDAETALWQSRYTTVTGQIQALRSEDERFKVTFKSAEGAEKTLAFSQLVRVLEPNRMGFFGKAGAYLSRVVEFIFGEPRESNTEGGVFPAIFGTVMMTLLMSLLVVPFGVVAALYLREYAKQGPLVSVVRIAVNNLAGVPSIVFGVFGLGFFVYGLGSSIDRIFFAEALPTPTYGTGGILWASLTLALLTVPVVVVATEEALAFVPKGLRDGSLACGATKWQTIRHVVLPSAAPGILTGMILAMARGAGEVAPLMITGVVKLAPNLPFDTRFPFMHLDRKFMHLGFHIYDVGFQSPNVEAAMPMVYTTTLLLIAVVVGLNLAAMVIRNRLRNRYRTSGF
ncbi:MAG: phosphate ABC transporter permease PstA [candidate division FCPU426 bacterium]